jgi:hypothetical protein
LIPKIMVSQFAQTLVICLPTSRSTARTATLPSSSSDKSLSVRTLYVFRP